MRWQAVYHQSHWFFAAVHHLLEQFDKQLSRQAALVGGEPKSTFGADRRCRADALALTRALNNWGFTSWRSRLAMHRIGAKARFIPEQYFGTTDFCL